MNNTIKLGGKKIKLKNPTSSTISGEDTSFVQPTNMPKAAVGNNNTPTEKQGEYLPYILPGIDKPNVNITSKYGDAIQTKTDVEPTPVYKYSQALDGYTQFTQPEPMPKVPIYGSANSLTQTNGVTNIPQEYDSAPPTYGNALKGNGNLYVPNKDIESTTDVHTGNTPSEIPNNPKQDASGSDSKMTYEQYIADQKKQEDERLQSSIADAERYKARAAADAQASYAQNMSTYGVNAETMAKMGLTGSGYSDYLNAQAYAQMCNDMQTADANALAMQDKAQTTYADNIKALDNDYANKKFSTYTSLLADVQNPNAYDNYSEEGIRALGKQWGWTDEETQKAVDILNKTKETVDISLGDNAEEESRFSAWNSALQSSESLVNPATGKVYTRDELKEKLWQDRNAGLITEKEMNQILTTYDWRIAKDNGTISSDTFYGAMSGDQSAIDRINTVGGGAESTAVQKATELIGKNSLLNVADGKNANIVDATSSNWKAFGDYQNNKKQEKYAKQLMEDALSDPSKIPVGALVRTNFGAVKNDEGWYIYVGDGMFVKVDYHGGMKDYPSMNIYIPDGYKINDNDKIRRE